MLLVCRSQHFRLNYINSFVLALFSRCLNITFSVFVFGIDVLELDHSVGTMISFKIPFFLFKIYYFSSLKDGILETIYNLPGKVLEEPMLPDLIIESKNQLKVTKEQIEEGEVSLIDFISDRL